MLPIGHAAPRLLLAMFTSCIIIVNAYFMSVVLPYFLKCIDRTVYVLRDFRYRGHRHLSAITWHRARSYLSSRPCHAGGDDDVKLFMIQCTPTS